MDFAPSSKVREFQDKLTAFMEEYVYPAEADAHEQIAASGDPPRSSRSSSSMPALLASGTSFYPTRRMGLG